MLEAFPSRLTAGGGRRIAILLHTWPLLCETPHKSAPIPLDGCMVRCRLHHVQDHGPRSRIAKRQQMVLRALSRLRLSSLAVETGVMRVLSIRHWSCSSGWAAAFLASLCHGVAHWHVECTPMNLMLHRCRSVHLTFRERFLLLSCMQKEGATCMPLVGQHRRRSSSPIANGCIRE